MCGRFSSSLPADVIRQLFKAEGEPRGIHPSCNIAPLQDVPVIRRHSPKAGIRGLAALRWGLVPHFTTELSSAPKPAVIRAEDVAISTLSRSAFARRRCLVPAEVFYEWQGDQPYAVARKDGAPFALGAIWEGWLSPEGEPVRTFALITTPANAEMSVLHDRMPLIVEQADWAVWLGEIAGDAGALLRAAPDGTVMAWPVSPRLNSLQDNDVGLIEPIRASRS